MGRNHFHLTARTRKMDIKIVLIICGVFAFINAAPVNPRPVVNKELQAEVHAAVWTSLPIIPGPFGLIQAVTNLVLQSRVKRELAVEPLKTEPTNAAYTDVKVTSTNWFTYVFEKIIQGAAYIVHKIF